MKLTDEQRQAFVDGLKEIGADDFACPVCKRDSFNMLDEFVYLYEADGSKYPNVSLMCVTCKHVLLFNAGHIEETKIDGIVCQECFEKEATMQGDNGVYMCSECWYAANG